MLKHRFYHATFFNRVSEIKQLTTLFNDKPTLTVLLGPINTGKTALVRKVLEQRDELGLLFHPLNINLMGRCVSSPDALLQTLCHTTSEFFRPEKKVHTCCLTNSSFLIIFSLQKAISSMNLQHTKVK